MTTALEHDILAELREHDLEVRQLRAKLRARGHSAGHEEVYGRLVHLEAMREVRLVVLGQESAKRMWGAR